MHKKGLQAHPGPPVDLVMESQNGEIAKKHMIPPYPSHRIFFCKCLDFYPRSTETALAWHSRRGRPERQEFRDEDRDEDEGTSGDHPPGKDLPENHRPRAAPNTPSRLRISAVWVDVVCLWATFWVTRANTVPRKML